MTTPDPIRAALEALSNCRDFVSDVAAGGEVTERSREHAIDIRVRSIAAIEAIESALATPPAPEGWNEAIDAAKEAVQNLRHAGACNFTDARYKGQRGQDHANALYDAYQAIRSLRRGAKESDGGSQVGLNLELSEETKKHLAEIDAAIVRPGDPRLNQMICGNAAPSDPTQETVTR